MRELDKLDRNILNELQDNAVLPLKELAARVHSSVATCQRRVQTLISDGIITKQAALVSPAAVGRQISVFVMVVLDNQSVYHQERFEQKMRQEPDVMSCYEISGDYDFLLLVHSADMPTYHAFTRRSLTSEYNVRSFKSQFVMNFSKVETKITL